MNRHHRRRLSLGSLLLVLLLSLSLMAACSGPGGGDDATSTTGNTGTGTGTGTGATTAPNEQSANETQPGTDTSAAPTTDPGTAAGETPSASDPGDPTAQVTTSPDTTAQPTTGTTPAPPLPPAGGEEGAILPTYRVVSYYGHPNSDQMGILGEFSKEEVLALLQEQGAAYEAADPAHPVKLAFELIATVAQNWSADNGTYTAYTGDEIIQEFVDFTAANDMLLILDLQIGWDTIPNQIEQIRKWLEYPHVHVGLDPEFSTAANEIVGTDRVPGEFIGEADGNDIQAGVQILSELTQRLGLPPKILILHQFESEMIYNKSAIASLPGVDIVLDMDGFGSPGAKVANYGHFVTDELIEYGGIKLFYRQDDPLMTPADVVALDPAALVVIYQ